METLVLAQHRNQYCSRSKSEIPDRFGSPPFRGFRDINCRTFQSGAGILPSPYSFQSPSATKKTYVSSPQTMGNVTSSVENGKPSKSRTKSNAIPIVSKKFESGSSYNDELPYSELWAGPTYSNSPPPSSLPIPKFSLRQKRSVSLDLPSHASGIKIHAVAKSAPPSPSRESHFSARNFFSTASATEDLRRILHLDVSDD